MNFETISILFVDPGKEGGTKSAAWIPFLEKMEHLRLNFVEALPDDLARFDVVVLSNADTLNMEEERNIQQYVEAGGGCLALADLSPGKLPGWFGAQPCEPGPRNEVRVLFQDRSTPLAARLPDAAYLSGTYQPLHITHKSTETVLYADWRYEHSPVLVRRPVGRGLSACTTLQDLAHPWLQSVLYRTVRELAGVPTAEHTLGIGLLGYSPAVGQLHGEGAEQTAGLALRAICDLSAPRRSAAGEHFPGIQTHATVDALCADDAVALVIIATPPNTHASLAIQVLEGGKHAICEKPLALNRAETDAMQAAAAERNLHVSCHQNRRWDVDYLAVRAALAAGKIGDPFYMETFVGGFEHPCGYWHSDETVSGGTTFDWGAHYLDWILSLIQEPVVCVTGTRQNRVWHDVTNADHERIQLRFAGGQEAEFTHSDIAAARKPKWYILGTTGAIVGDWQEVTSYTPHDVHYFDRHPIPRTEMPPRLTLHRRHGGSHGGGHSGGTITAHELPVPECQRYPFHANLADHLLLGEPVVAPVQESARVVAVLEAAAHSAMEGGLQQRVYI